MEVGAFIAFRRASAFSSILMYLVAFARSWSISVRGSKYKVSKNFPGRNPTRNACMATVGCRFEIFNVALANRVTYCLRPYPSPCTPLCKDSDIATDENQLKVAFYNEEQDHSPSHLKFFLFIFAKDKAQAQAQEGQSPQKPKDHPMKGKAKF